MKRMKPATKRKMAGIVAILLIAAMVLSSASVLFVDGAEITGYTEEYYES